MRRPADRARKNRIPRQKYFIPNSWRKPGTETQTCPRGIYR